MKSLLLRSSALIALALPAVAHAQSTGSVDFEGEAIVVTGAVRTGVEGVIVPETPKARQVLTQEQLSRNNPGQTVLDSINIIPGVSFTNNDAYGSGGGQLFIRGFSSDRVSLTFDGLPLNDSGNYAIYSNQQLDSEVIEQVNVNLGSTDVDSPTAAATGSTVNYRSRMPGEEPGVVLSASAGDFRYIRVFGMVDTGEFTPFGTRAFIAASKQNYDNPYNNYGEISKTQVNAKIYQPIGEGNDFIWVAGHFNKNRNNFFGSLPLRTDLTRSPTDSTPRNVGGGSNDRFPRNNDEREYNINFPCTTNQVARPGVADTPNTCGTEFDRRYNPSDTGNIRAASRFALSDSLTLTVDPSYQFTKANGGGTVGARERLNNGLSGYIGGRPYFGMDLNGDGDLLDEVTLLAPSQTKTDRYGVIANLRWDINDDHSVRVAYTLDHARHRQTGEVGGIYANGEPFSVFATDVALADVTGVNLQKRDRKSFAILNQVSGEYRGSFIDNRLTVLAGIRAPFFERELNNYCFTTSDSGFVDCFGGPDDPRNALYAAANPTIQGPQQRVLKYDDVLPNVGFTFDVGGPVSVFANYSKGLQVPGTDALYNAFFFPADTASARPEPETTDNFDGGVRYTTGNVQAQLVGWYTKYKNRLASAYDPITDRNVYRNLGDVEKYGIDGSIGWQPIDELFLYAFGSYLESEIKENVQSGTAADGTPLFIETAGKRESGAPEYTFGGQARVLLGPVDLGVTAKRTGGRYIYDTNLPIYGGNPAAPFQIYDAKTPAYWLVNLDARIGLEWAGINESTFLQLNVYNLFDQLYVGNFTNGLNQGGVIGEGQFTGTGNFSATPFAQIGAPRTVSVSVNVAF